MLTIREISSPDDQRVHLGQFNPSTCTWVVSDAKAKFDLQRQLIGKNGFLDGLAVVRASELWKVLLTRLRPDLQLVSSNFITTLISEQLTKFEFEWAKTSGAAETATSYMSQLMPILAHEQGKERLEDWFDKHETAKTRWKHWADLCFELWNNFLDQGVIAPAWVSGVLVNEENFEQVWQRDLIFDLGAEFNQVEADLINILKKKLDVTVLRPAPEWQEEYRKTLYAYELLQSDRTERTEPVKIEKVAGTSSKTYQKFTTMIAEVKNATAVTRQWLEAGVKASDIAIVAPDIECYWPSLFPYLREEGVSSQKDVVARLHTFPEISQWMATLRLNSGSVAESDLEVSLYDQESRPVITYDRFRVLYTAIYDRDDLLRESKIAQLYKVEHQPGSQLYRDEFVAWALKAWASKDKQADTNRIERLFKQFFTDCSPSVRLPTSRWLSFLELLAANGEERIIPGDSEGVSCINLRSAENSPATHMVFLGLTEHALKASSKTSVIFGDTLSLATQVGFHLNSPEHSKLEFEVRWMTENSRRHLHLYTPETDFDGTIQPPSWIWVQGRGETDVLQFSVPQKTRWDEIQQSGWSEIAEVRGWTDGHRAKVSESIEQDLGKQPLPKFAADFKIPLSPSTIENYVDCPFIFASKKLFGLQDKAFLDLDVDAATRGSIMHSLFKLLLEEPSLELSEARIEELVDTARPDGADSFDEKLWPPLKVRYVQLAKRFLEFEKDWRSKFPLAKTIAKEHSFNGFIQANGSLSQTEGVAQFRGRFDRIDQDDLGNYAVLDYKSSPNDLRQHGSWLKNNEIQLLLYSLALENGIASLPPGEVVEAVYFVARTMERETGLRLSDREQGLFVLEGRGSSKATSEQKEKLYAQIRGMLADMLKRMSEGDYAPKPISTKICERCNWSLLCRAPHLN